MPQYPMTKNPHEDDASSFIPKSLHRSDSIALGNCIIDNIIYKSILLILIILILIPILILILILILIPILIILILIPIPIPILILILIPTPS